MRRRPERSESSWQVTVPNIFNLVSEDGRLFRTPGLVAVSNLEIGSDASSIAPDDYRMISILVLFPRWIVHVSSALLRPSVDSLREIRLTRAATAKELQIARTDTVTGMSYSNLIMFFIILTTGATLYVNGQRDIETARQAAEALRPLAGEAAYVLFALGLIGTGMLGVPVLAGSAAYAVGEAFAWRSGMNERPRLATKFYAVIAVAMLTGLLLDYTGFNAIKMLFWSAVLNGLLAPPLIVIILMVCNNRRVMGEHVNGRLLNLFGIGAALVMIIAAVAMFLN